MIVTDKTDRKPKIDAVAVAAAMRQEDESVMEAARSKYAADLDTYQRGVRRAAETGGTLPPDETALLLAACRSLDIPAERLADDVQAIQKHTALVAEMAAIEARNVERHAPLPGLQAAFEKEQQSWMTTKGECDKRLKEAETRLIAARRALEQVERARMESSEQVRLNMIRVEDGGRHLFANVEPEQLRRIVRPEHRSVFS